MPPVELTTAELNHLRRLLGWVSCEVGQAPDELVATVRDLIPTIGPVTEEAKSRLVQSHQKASNVPLYVRAAVKSLQKAIAPIEATLEDVETSNDLKDMLELQLDRAKAKQTDDPTNRMAKLIVDNRTHALADEAALRATAATEKS